MSDLASRHMQQQAPLRKPNILLSVLFGIFLGCISASILYFVDFIIDSMGTATPAQQLKLDQFEMIEVAIASIFFAPLLETLVFQVLVFGLIGMGTQTRLRRAVIVSVLLFSGAHYIYGGVEHASRMILLGGILSLGYAWACNRSLSSAFYLTLFAHTTHNSIIIFLLFSS